MKGWEVKNSSMSSKVTHTLLLTECQMSLYRQMLTLKPLFIYIHLPDSVKEAAHFRTKDSRRILDQRLKKRYSQQLSFLEDDSLGERHNQIDIHELNQQTENNRFPGKKSYIFGYLISPSNLVSQK
ncbi:hypothetical protein FGO68_gene12867 [Halteria grandinella]|uniref:Uncharacterized protein n=1 Tax=Halteria grandinella TaxID=5974 RepID=A0A8J8NYZ9_HALGN|nr:hypothetical protein FGO68_gene12867 [Halteria grandinella]